MPVTMMPTDIDHQLNEALQLEDLDEEFNTGSILENLVKLNKQGMEHLSQGNFLESH